MPDRRVRVRTIVCSLLAAGLLACGATEPAKPTVKPTPPGPTPVEPKPVADAKPPTPSEPSAPPQPLAAGTAEAAARSINALAVDLHRALAEQPGDLFISPASIALAFAMTHAGARGTTERELAKVLHLGDDAAQARAGLAATLAAWGSAGGGVELAVANRLFGEQTVKFEPTFLDVTRTTFAAPLETIDFKGAPQPARARINKWVAERTHDKIKDLLPPPAVDAATRLVLVNAVYFKAAWEEPFIAAFTEPGKFKAAGGERRVSMMMRTDTYPAAVVADSKLRVIQMPYAGGEFALVIVLPDANDGLAAIEKGLTSEQLTAWLAQLQTQRVALKLPRFKIEPGEALALGALMKRLGLVETFDPGRADFTGMAPKSEQIYISDAYHKAFIAVDEQGTEAAAATAVSARAGAAPPSDPPLEFTADHPFLFMVRDVRSGAILFMGRLADPK